MTVYRVEQSISLKLLLRLHFILDIKINPNEEKDCFNILHKKRILSTAMVLTEFYSIPIFVTKTK